MTELADDEARRRIATEFGTTFFVEAAAGSGKTTALVRRIVGLIGAGISTLKRIVAITFTDRAARQMRGRIRQAIVHHVHAAPTADDAERWGRHLRALEVAPISTEDYPTPAKRPADSRLDCRALDRDFRIKPRPWREALQDTLDRLLATRATS